MQLREASLHPSTIAPIADEPPKPNNFISMLNSNGETTKLSDGEDIDFES